ncbi:MAG: hypothetical protein R3F37_12425 [Candidatus Competibacteraceae bacterium]
MEIALGGDLRDYGNCSKKGTLCSNPNELKSGDLQDVKFMGKGGGLRDNE